MGDALDDYYDRLDSLDAICLKHRCLYDGSMYCPKCEDERWDEALTEKNSG